VHTDTAEIVSEARLEEPARACIERNARRFKRAVMRRHAQRLFGVHTDAAEIVAEARMAVLALRHAQRLFGKLIGPLFAGIPGLTSPM
jgi:hypothetical protein